jgi:hypothetical protein
MTPNKDERLYIATIIMLFISAICYRYNESNQMCTQLADMTVVTDTVRARLRLFSFQLHNTTYVYNIPVACEFCAHSILLLHHNTLTNN